MISFKALIGRYILSCAAVTATAQVGGVATNAQGSLYCSIGTAVGNLADLTTAEY